MSELIKHINKLNEQTRARGAVGFLTNDLKHWASYGVYTIGDFQLYLEREHERNMEKAHRYNAQEWIDGFNDHWNKNKKPARPITGNLEDWRE